MKIQIDMDESIIEDEIIIKCSKMNEMIRKIHQAVLEVTSSPPVITYYHDNQEFFIPIQDILFYETDKDAIYAHTADAAYRVKIRLYELEEMLPYEFVRVSKSTILNTWYVFSIDRSLTSASLIKFHKSHKQVYCSRLYYKNLRQRLDERRNYEK